MEIEHSDLAERNPNHQDVNSDADCRIGPAHGVDVDAVPSGRLDILGPEVADGRTLKDGRRHKGYSKKNVEDCGAPEQATDSFSRENIEVEERQAELDEGEFGKV